MSLVAWFCWWSNEEWLGEEDGGSDGSGRVWQPRCINKRRLVRSCRAASNGTREILSFSLPHRPYKTGVSRAGEDEHYLMWWLCSFSSNKKIILTLCHATG